MTTRKRKDSLGSANRITELPQHKVVRKLLAVSDDPSKYILIHKDTTELRLRDFKSDLRKKTAWKTPLSLVIAILLCFITGEFHDWAGLTAAVWRVLWEVALGICFVWFVFSVFNSWRLRLHGDVDDCLSDMIKGSKI